MCGMHHVQISVYFWLLSLLYCGKTGVAQKIPQISSERWSDLLLLDLFVYTPGQRQQKCRFLPLWWLNHTSVRTGLFLPVSSTCLPWSSTLHKVALGSWSRCCLRYFAEKSQGWLNRVICKAAVFDSSNSIARHFWVEENRLHILGDCIHLLLCIPSSF